MAFKKTISTLTLLAMLGLNSCSYMMLFKRRKHKMHKVHSVRGDCTTRPEYEFEGKIGKDHVQFESICLGKQTFNILDVQKPDGKRFFYQDHKNNDLELDYVSISWGEGFNESYRVYTDHKGPHRDPEYEEHFKKYKEQFSDYLEKILEKKK